MYSYSRIVSYIAKNNNQDTKTNKMIKATMEATRTTA